MTLPLICVKSSRPLPRPTKSHTYCTHIHATYAYQGPVKLLVSPKTISLFPLCQWLPRRQPLNLQTCHGRTHSLSLPLRPLPPGSRYGFVKSERRNEWIDGPGEGRWRTRSAEWTLGSKLLCQSIFPLGTLDESCPNFPPVL